LAIKHGVAGIIGLVPSAAVFKLELPSPILTTRGANQCRFNLVERISTVVAPSQNAGKIWSLETEKLSSGLLYLRSIDESDLAGRLCRV